MSTEKRFGPTGVLSQNAGDNSSRFRWVLLGSGKLASVEKGRRGCSASGAVESGSRKMDTTGKAARSTAAAAVSAAGPHTALYPPALAVVLPETQHITGKLVQQEIERDHGHLKGRYRPMRGFKQRRCAQVVCAGHSFMRNVRDGFYQLGFVWYGPGQPHPPCLFTVWDELTRIHRPA